MSKMLIPRVTPDMIRSQPDQFASVLNRLIDWANAQQK